MLKFHCFKLQNFIFIQKYLVPSNIQYIAIIFGLVSFGQNYVYDQNFEIIKLLEP